MNYQEAKGRSSPKKTFIMLRHDIFQSDAWRDLNNNARSVWLEIMYRYNGYNNGEIPLSCREAGDLCGISKNTASLAFKELQAKGFLEIGGYSNFDYKMKRSTRWIVTHEKHRNNPPKDLWKKYKRRI